MPIDRAERRRDHIRRENMTAMPAMMPMPMMSGMMPMMNAMMPMMNGMMPMPMMTQMTYTMTPEGMTCQMKPMDGMTMEMFTQCCERMMAMMTAGMPMMMACGGMPMMMCAMETK
jgi:hypothetical protein